VFEIDSHVGRYWLANGEGFDVVADRGRRIGVVEDVVVNPLTQEVSGVVVRHRHRHAEVPVGEMTAVQPASQRFLVSDPDRPSATDDALVSFVTVTSAMARELWRSARERGRGLELRTRAQRARVVFSTPRPPRAVSSEARRSSCSSSSS
jgi:sporulation protein YlmC with PRC-barrel domain